MPSSDQIAATRRLLEAAGIAVRWSAREELRPGRVVRLPAATAGARSVVVKVADGGGQGEGSHWALHNEWAALSLFGRLGTRTTPRLVAADLAAGVLVMEDLGDGPSLATLLLGPDPEPALEAARRSAASLGTLHAATIGWDEEYAALRRQVDPTYEPHQHRSLLRGMRIDERVAQLPGLLSAYDLPPLSGTAGVELDDVVDTLAHPAPFLVLSNGDPCPDNERVGPGGSRFFDFEAAGYHHALIDAAHYRIPFPNCWCWRRLPPDVARTMESSYRASLATGCTAALDDAVYEPALMRITAAWLVWTLHRRLVDADTDQLSRQRIVSSLAGLAADEAADRAIPGITDWAGALLAVLGRRWPQSDSPATYPAFGGPPFEVET